MPDPLSIHGLQTGQLSQVARPEQKGPTTTADGKSFKDLLLDSLNEVNRLQQEAASGVERVVTGQTDNLAEVFTAVKNCSESTGLTT